MVSNNFLRRCLSFIGFKRYSLVSKPVEGEVTVDLHRLKKEGYRFVSRKYGHASRIDREDWKEHMAKIHSPWSLEEGLGWVEILGEWGAEDHYRRGFSKDIITFDEDCKEEAYRVLGSSSTSEVTGYCEKQCT